MKRFVGIAFLAILSCRPPAETPSADRVRASVRLHASEGTRVLTLVSARIDKFFADRDDGVDRLVEELMSFRGKWRAVFWSREDFEAHVRRRFAGNIFRDGDFEREVLDPVRADLAFVLEACEAKVAVDVDLAVRGPAAELPGVRLKAELSSGIGAEVVRDLEMNLVSITGSEYAAVLATTALAQSGVFGASVAAGASQSWWNLGAGIVVGVVVGLIVDGIVGDACEDAVRAELRKELAALRTRMLEGVDGPYEAAKRLLAAHARVLEERAVKRFQGGRDAAARA